MTSLNEESIRQALAGDMLVGREVRVLPEVGSTNDYLKEAARGGAPEGLAVLAERQTAGKGRLGRSFQSPAGLGLWMSVLLRPTCPPECLPPVTALTAAACAEAIREVCGAEAGIKWPNDLVLDGRKLCGILTELESGGEGLALVIGIGLNVSQRREDFPPELRETAGSLAMLRALDRMYRDLLADDLDAWRGAYRAACVNLGREVRILRPDREEQATALDVDRDFGLMVRLADGREEILRSGEVSVRGLSGYAEG